MGIFSMVTIRELRIPLFTDQQRFLIEQLALYADDNTAYEQSVNPLGKKNIVGYHTYPSLRKMSKDYGKSYAALSKAKKELLEMDIIKEAEKQLHRTTITYAINFSKIFRLADYYCTIRSLHLDKDDTTVTQFFNSAMRSYEDDYLTFPVRSITAKEKGICIHDWDDLVYGGDDALEEFWRTYRQKKIGAVGSSTDNQANTKNDDHDFSISHHSITSSRDDNQEFLDELLEEVPEHIDEERWLSFKKHFPHRQLYQTKDKKLNQTVKFGLEQLNPDGELDPKLANYWNADEEEYFNKWKTGGLFQLGQYNAKWEDCLQVLSERKFHSK